MATPLEGLDRLRDAAATQELDELCYRLDLQLLVAFGSTVDPHRLGQPNDLDVAIRLQPHAKSDVIDATNALIDLTGTSAVDVLNLATAGVVASAQALGPPNLPLFEANNGDFALAQMGALTYAMETAPMRRRDLELLAER